MQSSKSKQLGVVIGGSGLIGGAINHYFKGKKLENTEILSPNSKRLSLRVKEDIRSYFTKIQPSYIVNSAISPIDSDPLLAFETNYLGAINLAKVAIAYKIPYIHVSSASTMPMGENLSEDNTLRLRKGLANYRKSKLMAEHTLKYLHEKEGLDYTIIRLAVVYGKHDHKIQGFHRLLFSIADQSMPFLLTKKGIYHSYSSTKKVGPFIEYILKHRDEFGGQTYNFVDPDPVELVHLTLTIKSYLESNVPKEIYIPYSVTHSLRQSIKWMIRRLSRFGVEVRIPAELMFMKNFYKTQTLSCEKLLRSSFKDPTPQTTIYSEIPELLEYYLTRWEHLNLITGYNKEFFDPQKKANEFLQNPNELLEAYHSLDFTPKKDFSDLL